MISLARVRELARIKPEPQREEKSKVSKVIEAKSLKVVLPLKAGSLPQIDPNDPTFVIRFPDGQTITGRCNAKAARKCQVHQGGAVLQGKLTAEKGRLCLEEAGFQFIPAPALEQPEAKPAQPPSEGTGGVS